MLTIDDEAAADRARSDLQALDDATHGLNSGAERVVRVKLGLQALEAGAHSLGWGLDLLTPNEPLSDARAAETEIAAGIAEVFVADGEAEPGLSASRARDLLITFRCDLEKAVAPLRGWLEARARRAGS